MTRNPNREYCNAMAAIYKARAAYPNLTPLGFDDTADENANWEWDPEEVWAALAFLKQCEPDGSFTYSSYSLRRMVERWGRTNGLVDEVIDGAVIVAAVALDLPIHRKGAIAMIAVRLPSELQKAAA